MDQDGIANSVIAIAQPKLDKILAVKRLNLKKVCHFCQAYCAFPCIVVAQTVSLLASLKVGNTPDTPSATGTVNRVVQGVTIHSFDN